MTSHFASGLPYFVASDCTSCRVGAMNQCTDTVILTSQFASDVKYPVVSNCTSCRVGAMN